MKETVFANLNHLSEAQREQALQRFYLLRPFLEEEVPLTVLAQQHHLALRTAQRWVQAYRQNGLTGLIRQPRLDRGQRRDLKAELHHLIEALALQKPKLSCATVYRKVKEVADQQGWKAPSYSRVYHIISQLEPGLVVLAQKGPKVYKEEFDLLYRREANRSNEIWQADHTLLDIWLINERGKPARPWLTIIEDDYSRAIAGYMLSFQAPSALQTALTLRQAIWRKSEANWHVCGIPEIFYTDHGSDFTSQHLEQVSADLKIQLVFSQVGVPRGRGKIERFFKTVNQLLLSGLPGQITKEGARAEPQLTLGTFEELLRAFLLQTYHFQAHSETGIAPQARWEAQGFLPNLPESLEQLDLLLLTVARSRQIQQDGIHFQGLRYLDVNLAAYVGEAVTIRYDPRDMAEIRVFHHNKFLCRAVCQELAEQTVSLKEIVQARNQRRRELQSQLSNTQQIVEVLMKQASAVQTPSLGLEPEQVALNEPGPGFNQAEVEVEEHTPKPKRLKRYYNE